MHVRRENMSDNAPVVRLLMGFRTFGLLLLLLFAIPGWARSAGFDEVRAAAQELKKIREIRDRQGLERIAYLAWDLARSAEARAAAGDLAGAERALTLAEEFDPALPDVFFTRARIYLQRGSPRGVSSLVRGWG